MAIADLAASRWSRETTLTSLDGLRLQGTLCLPPQLTAAAVLVHGGGVNREEGGFYTRLAAGLADAGVASLRFDFRGHGASEGRQEDLTLTGVVNDIRSAVVHLGDAVPGKVVALIGASFGGGISAYYASQFPQTLSSLVLLNPLLSYKKRLIDDKAYWRDDRIDPDHGAQLTRDGFLPHSPTFKLGRPLLNELFYLRPDTVLHLIQSPTLFVHGTKDTFIPVDSSRAAVAHMCVEAQLEEIDGSQHGFAVHDDPQYAQSQTQQWQAHVIDLVTRWVARHSP